MSTADAVRNFVERDRALCAAALDGDRDVLLRAAEMLRDAGCLGPQSDTAADAHRPR